MNRSPRSAARLRVFLVLLLIVGGGLAVTAAAAERPKRIGPIVTIASGSDWLITAWRSDRGICFSYGAPGIAGDGCDVRRRPLELLMYARASHARFRIIGIADPHIARVSAKLADGRTVKARIYRTPKALKTHRRFFVVEFVLRHFELPKVALAGYDARGNLVARSP